MFFYQIFKHTLLSCFWQDGIVSESTFLYCCVKELTFLRCQYVLSTLLQNGTVEQIVVNLFSYLSMNRVLHCIKEVMKCFFLLFFTTVCHSFCQRLFGVLKFFFLLKFKFNRHILILLINLKRTFANHFVLVFQVLSAFPFVLDCLLLH